MAQEIEESMVLFDENEPEYIELKNELDVLNHLNLLYVMNLKQTYRSRRNNSSKKNLMITPKEILTITIAAIITGFLLIVTAVNKGITKMAVMAISRIQTRKKNQRNTLKSQKEAESQRYGI